MSRHRNVRSMNYDKEYEDYYGSYGQSVEDDCCVSPNTERQFMYSREQADRRRAMMIDEKDELREEEDLEMELDNDLGRVRTESVSINGQFLEEALDKEVLLPCIEKMQDVLGEDIPDSALIKAARFHNYDPDAAIDALLSKTIPPANATLSPPTAIPKIQKISPKATELLPCLEELNGTTTTEPSSTNIVNDCPSSFYLTLTAQCNLSKPEPKVAIKKHYLKYLQKNNNTHNKVFDFSSPSPDEIVLKPKKEGSRGNTNMNAVSDPNDSCDAEVAKINENMQKLAVKKFDSPSRNLSPLRDRSPAASREGSRRSSPTHDKPSNLVKMLQVQSKAMKPEAALLEYKNRSEGKPLINLVVIGHVDAGKSTLMGHLLCKLGFVSQKQLHRYETDSKKVGKASFMYAWVLDETEAERTRGITMDIATSRFETTNRNVTLLDAPGHKDFIPNMITGAAQADVALLVVDATTGEFETGFESGGQTREHTMLIKSLGVSQLAVVINKIDNVNYSLERYNEIVKTLSVFLKQTGFKDVTYVPCSGLTGENLAEKPKNPIMASWYDGPCLSQVIDSFQPPERPINKPFRMCIGDIFKGITAGLCISGRIEAGSVQVGQKLVILPEGEQCSIKAISIDDSPSENCAFAGDQASLTLTGCDAANISIGSLVCDLAFPAPVTTKFVARIVLFNTEIPVTKGFPFVLHFQSLSEQATVKKLISQLQKNSLEVMKKRPRCLTKNSSGLIQVEVNRPICIELYSQYKDLGRFMMRCNGSTIAAGVVTEIL